MNIEFLSQSFVCFQKSLVHNLVWEQGCTPTLASLNAPSILLMEQADIIWCAASFHETTSVSVLSYFSTQNFLTKTFANQKKKTYYTHKKNEMTLE